MKKSNSPDMLRKYYCNREFPFLTSFENYLKSAIDENILFCIGNGFDLAHGAMVSYSKFQSYLKKYQSDLFAALNRRIGFNDVALWSDFENQLVYLRDTYKNSNLCSKKELDDFNHDIDLITSMLKQSFKDWMNCTDDDFKIYISSNNLKYINLIRSNSYYLTFNYTEFLEDSSLYHVNHDNVFHIHGCRLDPASELMTGFNIPTNYALNLNASPDIVNGGVIIGGYSANTNATSPIANYLHDFSKYSYFLEHRQQFSSFFNKIKHCDSVVILGHSLGFPDREYFKLIHKTISPRAKWYIGYYSLDNEVYDKYYRDNGNIKVQADLISEFIVELNLQKDNVFLFNVTD